MESIKFIPPHWLNFGLDHTSPTQSNKSNGLWAGQYLCCTNEERRKFRVKPVMFGGTTAQLGINTTIIDKMDEDVAAKEGAYQYNLNKLKFTDDLDKIHFQKIHEGMPQLVRNGIAALKEIFPKYKKQKIVSERNISKNLPGIELPMIGYIDYESKDVVVEVKTKQRKKPRQNKDGEWVSYSGSLPKNPEIFHVKQTGFYKKATNKKIFIVYVNDAVPGINKRTKKDIKGYEIFDDSHDLLTDEHIDLCWENYRITNKVRQNIVSKANSLEDILAQIDPEFNNGFWDFGDEYVARCKQLWGQV